MTSNTSQGIASGAAWMIGMQLSVTTLGFVSTLILARLLKPSDFGLVALATALVAAIDLLTSFRFEVPLIQNQDTTRDDYDSAWTLNLLFAAALALLLLIASVPAAAFFNEPRLTGVMWALALSAVLGGAQNIGIVNFRKHLEFHKEFIFTTLRKVASVTVAVTAAWVYRSYWALAAGIVTSSVVGLLASFAMQGYRPRLSIAAARRLFTFSKWLLLDNLVQFLRTRSADLLIGKLSGTGSLGLFNVGLEMATLAQQTVTAPINRALLPGYSRMQGNLDSLREAYLATVGITTLIAVPMALGIAAVAPLLVPLVLGEHWLGTIPFVEWLGFASAVTMCGTGAPIIYLALGRPRLSPLVGMVEVTLLLLGIALLLPNYGPIGAAWAMLGTALLILPVRLALAESVIGSVLRRWFGAVWRPALAGLLMYVCVTAVPATSEASGATATAVIALAESVGLGIVVYVAALAALWLVAGKPAGAETTIAATLRRYLLR